MSFHHNEHRVYDLYNRGLLQEALAFLRDLDPAARGESLFFDYAEASILAVVGAQEASLDILKALCRGEGWIDPCLLTDDPDFRPLLGRSSFKEVVDCYRERMEADIKNARVTKTVLYPAQQSGAQKLLLILHGDNSCAAHTLKSWSSAIEAGWSVVALQSKEIGSFAGAYRWRSYQEAVSAVEEVLSSLQADDFGRTEVVLGGFSRGGEVALRLALDGVGRATRALAVCPAPMDEPTLLGPGPRPALEECYIFAGEKDPELLSAEAAADRLSSLGVSVQFDRRGKYGHEYPSDFSAVLVRYLLNQKLLPTANPMSEL